MMGATIAGTALIVKLAQGVNVTAIRMREDARASATFMSPVAAQLSILAERHGRRSRVARWTVMLIRVVQMAVF